MRRWHPALPALACIVLLAALALQVQLEGPLARMDERATLFFAAHRQPWLTWIMRLLADAHGTAWLLAATALVALWRGWRRDATALRLLAVVPAGMLLNVGLKQLMQRVRPVLDEPLVHLATYSFPSGHAVASTVFYGALCALVLAHARTLWLRRMALAVAAVMVLLVCFSRVYLGAHYPSDVIAGVAVGFLCLSAFRRWSARSAAAD